ncbi:MULTISPECIES: hypothetical protein [Alicyclobacillus]|uniref:Uncharacterized protein n=1 Tax=Alicyclobacillus acidoterrestris (strain ATCC 49025 / DSM 3922 / CIP 106132 / NCIMB 13137 / GD3B) TaxID=1356854 RepID=T0BJX7_ALIAG|nr:MULTISPECIES: hypothetical protein [Alicyclobacillus]EPZ44298.1 hypothetical protein N007_11220 [Alicyclobacillus acidoterrestris ATCC 49025]UNO51079.1 hypothetical protein K1I37_21115 [Alicyclobacillus acidoterrestris]GEO27707.1 hypothetical protein AAC03nite_34920 [Alicyclobacillus acidoterrestris]
MKIVIVAIIVIVTLLTIILIENQRSKRKRSIQAAQREKVQKGTKEKPIQTFLPIVRVEATGEMVLQNDAFRQVIQVGNLNPFALSETEARAVRDNFKTMFGMFHQPVQFIVRGRRMDLTDYRQYFSQTYRATAEKWENDRLLEYGRHLEAHLVEHGNRQRTIRENLFITQADTGLLGEHDLEELRRTLRQETETAYSGLARCRVSPHILSSEETIEAQQFFWNRERIHARARDAVAYQSLKEYLIGDESEVNFGA